VRVAVGGPSSGHRTAARRVYCACCARGACSRRPLSAPRGPVAEAGKWSARPCSQRPAPMGCLQSKGQGPRPAKLLDKYTLGAVLGQGAFGIVYACKRKSDGKEFAVKMIDQVETPLEEIKEEVGMMRRLAHPYVVRLHDVYYEKVFVCMVLDLCQGGDFIEGMQSHWKDKGVIPVPVVRRMARMMVEAAAWLHQNDIVHRDIKGDNFLQDRRDISDPQCRIFLSDFGTVTECPPDGRLHLKCGTKTYWSPEFYDKDYGLKVDVFALGVVLFGTITGRFPFKGEDATRKKTVKVPERCGDDGRAFMDGLLEKREEDRFSSQDALDHRFVANIAQMPQVSEEPVELNFKAEVREQGANAGVKERRLELVERLEKQQELAEQAQKTPTKTKAPKTVVPVHLPPDGAFEVVDKVTNRINKFDWWSPSRCTKVRYMNEPGARTVTSAEDLKSTSMDCEDTVRQMLVEHGISIDLFGQGRAKKFSEFAAEVQGGLSCLMLDATTHKCIVRVVDVVICRLAYGIGKDKKYLVTFAEKYPDGRVRDNIYQLPGTKRHPHENGVGTAQRLLRERLNIADDKVRFDFMRREVLEEDDDSPSYPGVRTVYRKEFYEGVVRTTDVETLQRLGLQGKHMGSFSHQDSTQYTRYFEWLTEAQCHTKQVKLRVLHEGAEISALVRPPIGMEEEELREYLSTNNVDTDQFGKNGVCSLADLSEELIKGESALAQKPGGGGLVRVVEVVALKITRANGDALIQVEEEHVDGRKIDMNCLPCVKRRPDENPFWAAHRGVSRVLKFSDNVVRLVPDSIELVEEEVVEPEYGSLTTIRRRRIISGTMADMTEFCSS